VPGVENYQRDPGARLVRLLDAWEWEPVGPGLWGKGPCRLYVDSVGVFLYQVRWVTPRSGYWRKTHGLSHNLIRSQTSRIVFKDLSVLDLMTGEWQEFPING
jgi:hypothetical protein